MAPRSNNLTTEPQWLLLQSSINMTFFLIYQQTVRVTTNMKYNIEQDAPILVVIRQIRGIVSWTLPYAFSNG